MFFFIKLMPGSDERPVERPNKVTDLKDPKQIGFGQKNDETVNAKKERNIDSDILKAMKSAQIKASKFSFNPTQDGKGVSKKKKTAKKLNFTFV